MRARSMVLVSAVFFHAFVWSLFARWPWEQIVALLVAWVAWASAALVKEST